MPSSAGGARVAAAKFLRVLLDAGKRVGNVDTKRVLREIGVADEEVVNDPAGWVDVNAIAHAWRLVPELSGDSSFGLHAAEDTPLGVYGPLDLATMSSPTVADALVRVERYYRLLGAMSDLAIIDGGRVIRAELRIPILSNEDHRHYFEHLFGLMVTRIKMAVREAADPNVDIAVRFAHASPKVTTEHERIFGKRITFSANKNELHLSKRLLACELRTANPELAAILERESQRLALRPDAPFRDQVCAAIEQGLREGAEVTLDTVARVLGQGKRTAQRQLQSDGTSFADLLDEVRARIAKQQVLSGANLGEVTFTLGFSQPSAFHRAFRRWTGMTPKEFQASGAARHAKSTD